MRLEQLVLYGPGDDDRIRFGPNLTLFGGLAAADRHELIETIIDALTGRLTNASVVYVDHEGRRVYADRTGATFASDGIAAPGPSDLLGKDPATVAELLTIGPVDLGLGRTESGEDLRRRLSEARATLEILHTEHVKLLEQAGQLEDWQAELVELDRRIETSDDDLSRWTWQEQRRDLDEMRTELNMHDSGMNGEADRTILASVEALRTAGANWADLAANCAQIAAELGPVPEVSADDLARVAATPASLPTSFSARMDAWRAAHDAFLAAQADAAAAADAPAAAEDPLVDEFARLDQAKLWSAHASVLEASSGYAEVNARPTIDDDLADETDRAIEAAHIEVVRAERKKERLARPGLIGSITLAAGGVLAVLSVSVIVGLVMIVGAVGLAYWLLFMPHRELARATENERHALSASDAGSWLGLHLRRLDSISDAADRKRVEGAANNWIVATVDWEEVAGDHTPDELTAREDAVRAQAQILDPKAIAARREQAGANRDAASEAEKSARRSLGTGLEAYGVPGALSEDPERLGLMLERRVAAGALARRAVQLHDLQVKEASAAAQLEGILTRLGFTDGDLEGRLGRAIQAVNVARQRQTTQDGPRDRTQLEAEIARLSVLVERTWRPAWTDESELASAPIDPDLLEARRRELAELVAAGSEPDVVGAENRYRTGLARVRDLETRLEELSAGAQSVNDRLTARLRRTSWIGGREEMMPVLMDDALRTVPGEEKITVLERLLQLAGETQIILLTDDPAAVDWARDAASKDSAVTLFEVESSPAPVRPVTVG